MTRQPVKVETAPGPTALEAGYILFHVNANPKRGWSMHTLLHDGSICYWGQGVRQRGPETNIDLPATAERNGANSSEGTGAYC